MRYGAVLLFIIIICLMFYGPDVLDRIIMDRLYMDAHGKSCAWWVPSKYLASHCFAGLNRACRFAGTQLAVLVIPTLCCFFSFSQSIYLYVVSRGLYFMFLYYIRVAFPVRLY